MNIAKQLSALGSFDSGYTHIENDGTGFDPLGLHEVSYPYGRNDNVGASDDVLWVFGCRVNGGNRRVDAFAGHQQPEWATNGDAATDDCNFSAFGGDLVASEQFDDAGWGARQW